MLLQACLESLAELDYPADRYEVLVVDDGGVEPLAARVLAFQDRLAIRLLRHANAGPGAARNLGASQARGHYLAFTDDDCRPEPGWLRAFAAALAQEPGQLLGGQTFCGLTHNRYSTASQLLQRWLYGYCETHDSPMRFFASNNLCLPANPFLQAGGFDTTSLRFAAEDRELCGRWQASGGKLAYVQLARVWHSHRLDLRGFLMQHFAYGRGAYRLRLARFRRGLPPLPGDVRWIWQSLFYHPFADCGVWPGAVFSLLIFGSHAANVAGYVYERLCAGD